MQRKDILVALITLVATINLCSLSGPSIRAAAQGAILLPPAQQTQLYAEASDGASNQPPSPTAIQRQAPKTLIIKASDSDVAPPLMVRDPTPGDISRREARAPDHLQIGVTAKEAQEARDTKEENADSGCAGLEVTAVEAGSAASQMGLMVGDTIKEVGELPACTLASVRSRLALMGAAGSGVVTSIRFCHQHLCQSKDVQL